MKATFILAHSYIHTRLREQLRDARAEAGETERQASESIERLQLELKEVRATNASLQVRSLPCLHLGLPTSQIQRTLLEIDEQ